ncbi:MAG: MFS transporter [Acidobacteriota bacterium]
MSDSGLKRINSGVRTLGWASLLTDVSSDMIYPLLPDFLTRTLGAGPAVLGLIEGIAESTASITKVLSGSWSDRAGRRKPLVVAGYSVAAVARPLVGLATAWAHVLAIRFADRVGKGIRTAPRDALIADLTPPEGRARAFGLQRAMDNAGAVIGPLVAAALLRILPGGERSVFLLALFPGLAAVALIVWRVRERAVAEAPIARPPLEAPPATSLPRSLWIVTGIFLLFTLANSTDAFLLLRARDCGVPLWQIPLLWSFFHAVKASAGVPGGALADRIGRVPAVALGWAVYVAAYAGFAYVERASTLWALFALYGLFFALTEGAERALVAELAGARLRGRAFGVFHGAIGLASLPASVLFGVCWNVYGARAAFLIGAALASLALAALLAARSRLRPAAGLAA